MSEPSEETAARVAWLKRVWTGFVGFPLVAALVVGLIGPEPWPPGPLPMALASLAGPIVALLFVLRFSMLGPGLGLAWLEGSGDLDWKWTDAESRDEALERYTRGSLVAWALTEVVALLGVAGFWIHGNAAAVGGPLLGALVLFALQLPRWQGVRAVRRGPVH